MPFVTDEQKNAILKKKLMEEYLAQKGQIDKDQSLADNAGAYAQIGNAIGRVATDYKNADNAGSFLYQNAFRPSGDKPTMIGGEDDEWDDSRFNNLAKAVKDRQTERRSNMMTDLSNQQKLTQWDRENTNAERDDAFEGEKQKYQKGQWAHEESRRPVKDAFEDSKIAYDTADMAHKQSRWSPDDEFEDYQREQRKIDDSFKNAKSRFETDRLGKNSEVSKNARVLWQSMMMSKAAEARAAGDNAGAKAIMDMAKNADWSAQEYYDSVKLDPDYKSVLAANMAKDKLAMEKAKSSKPGKGAMDLPNAMAARDMRLKAADELMSLYEAADKKNEVGPVMGRISRLKSDFGFSNSPETDLLNTKMMTTLNQYIHDITGASAGVEEQKRLKAALGDITNDKALFKTKLKAGLDEADKIIEEMRRGNDYAASMGISQVGREPASDDSGKKRVVSREYSKSRNQTRVTYSDGSQEFLNGKKN